MDDQFAAFLGMADVRLVWQKLELHARQHAVDFLKKERIADEFPALIGMVNSSIADKSERPRDEEAAHQAIALLEEKLGEEFFTFLRMADMKGFMERLRRLAMEERAEREIRFLKETLGEDFPEFLEMAPVVHWTFWKLHDCEVA